MFVSEVVIERAIRGESEAQREIHESFYPRVYRLVRRIVGETDADDVSQDAFMRVLSKLDSQLGCMVSRSTRPCSTSALAIGIQPNPSTRIR